MILTQEIVNYGVPLGVAIVTALGCWRCLPESVARRYAAAAAVAAAFFVGYAMLPSWAELAPKRHWQWLPYLGVAAMILGPIGLADGVSKIERFMLYLLLAITAAWLLVPTWASLQPPRSTYVPLLSGYLFMLMVLLQPLPGRVSGKLFCILLSLVALATALTIAAFISLRYGRVSAVAGTAVVGCCVAAFFQKDQLTIRGVMPIYAVLIGGLAFVGFVEPEMPLFGVLVMPAAPLALWVVGWLPFVKSNERLLMVVQTTAVLVVLVIGVSASYLVHAQ